MRLDELYARDKGICHLCEKPVPRAQASRDHLIPRSVLRQTLSIAQREALGKSETNIALAHKRCNSVRGSATIEEAKLVNDRAHPDPRYFYLKARKGHHYCECPCACKIQIPDSFNMTICDTFCKEHYISLI